MKIFTRTFVLTACCLFLTLSSFGANITIIESQSIHPLHKMDTNWSNIATTLGHNATIENQSFMDDYANFSGTDVLIIASGLIDIPDNRRDNILQFVENGGNVYIQSEYLSNLSGNIIFEYIAENLGNTFSWDEEVAGNLSPMEISGEMAEGMDEDNTISYYWYGTSGTGDDNFIPFLHYDNKDWGFIYCSSDLAHGKMITTSDQDWIRTSSKNDLMENILSFLANSVSYATPTVSISEEPCEDIPTFTATITNNNLAVQIEWLINGQVVAGENELTFSSNDLVDGDVVECRISLAQACVNYVHVSNPILIAPIFPIETPELIISANNTNACEGQSILFTATSNQSTAILNIAYQWLINGSPVSGADADNFFSASLSDQDVVSCQLIYDTNCATDLEVFSNEVTVNISPALNPSISIIADLTEICAGETITFTANGIDLGANPSFQWLVDGNNVGDNSPVFSSADLTDGQNINCLVTTNAQCATTNEANSNIISITVNEVVNPTIEIVASATNICTGESITFTANATDFGANPSYQWQIDGLNVGTNQPSFETSTLTDGQQISCILSVAESCTNSAAVTSAPIAVSVSQGEVPTLDIVSNANIICAGQAATFTASGENHGANPVYEWFVNGISVGNNATQLTLNNISINTTVSYTLFVEDNCIAYQLSQSEELTVFLSDIAIHVIELAHENCNSSDGSIEVNANGGVAPYTYNWSNGGTTSLLSQMNAGTYDLLVTDANGCTAIKSIEIKNNEAPQIADVLNTVVSCENEDASAEVIIANPSADLVFEWTNEAGEVISNHAKVDGLSPGIYEIAVTNQYGCEQFETIEIEAVSPLSLTLADELRMDLAASVQLEALVNTSATLSYEWFPANGLSCTDCANPVANPTSSTEYTVIVRNEYGCEVSADVLVRVIPRDDLFIPNAFSPNGDGVNDYFTAFAGENVARITTLRVFDRWGAEVFHNQDFSPNVETEGWDGTFKGSVLKMGVYVYFIEVEYIDGSSKIKKGDLIITL